MENEISRDELKSCLTQEYSKLLVKGEELLNDTPAGSEFWNIDSISLRADGQFGRFMFINMMYNEAKAFWLFAWLDCPTFKGTIYRSDNEKYKVDAWSEPKDHLHMLSELVLPRDHCSPHAKQLSEKTLSKFEPFGDVHGFGFSDLKPLLVLVDTHDKPLDAAPPQYVDDDYCRTFELQFLLLTRFSCINHVIAGLNIFDRWVLYDDLNLPCGDFILKSADFKDDFIILFAGYVNITKDQDRDVPYGVPEEGYQGTVPFNPSRGFMKKEHND